MGLVNQSGSPGTILVIGIGLDLRCLMSEMGRKRTLGRLHFGPALSSCELLQNLVL